MRRLLSLSFLLLWLDHLSVLKAASPEQDSNTHRISYHPTLSTLWYKSVYWNRPNKNGRQRSYMTWKQEAREWAWSIVSESYLKPKKFLDSYSCMFPSPTWNMQLWLSTLNHLVQYNIKWDLQLQSSSKGIRHLWIWQTH